MKFTYNDILNDYTYQKKINNFDFSFINKPTNKIGIIVNIFSGAFQERYYDNGKIVQLPQGIAHVIEHMKIAEDEQLLNNSFIEDYSINGSVSIAKTQFCISSDCQNFYDNLFERFFKVALCLNLNQNIFEEQIKVIKTEAIQVNANLDKKDDDYIEQVLAQITGNDLDTNLIGTKQSLDAISLEDLKKYYEINYVKDNVAIWVVGNFDSESKIENFSNKFSSFVNNIKETNNELFISEKTNEQIYRSFDLKFPDFEIHQLSKKGNVHNLFIGQSAGIDPSCVNDYLKVTSWIKSFNIWNIGLQMFKQKFEQRDSSLRNFLNQELDINWDNITFDRNNKLFGFTSYYLIQSENDEMYVDKNKLYEVICKAIAKINLYFDFETFEEFYKLSDFNKHIANDITFTQTYNNLMLEQKYAYAPVCYKNQDENLLKVSRTEVEKIMLDFTKSKNILNAYFIKED